MTADARKLPLAIDLFCGLGGWTDGLLAEGYDVVGFDITRHVYGEHRYPAQLVLQDVTTLHGSQFKNAVLIVASPPYQEYSYMAMPWTIAKDKGADIRADVSGAKLKHLNRLFDACFRIQREASAAAGHHVPIVIENVRGAQPWVGRSRWNYGSYHLWGDVPALMPMTKHALKGGWQSQANGAPMRRDDAVKVGGLDWSKHGQPGYAEGPGRCFRDSAFSCVKIENREDIRRGAKVTPRLTNPAEHFKDDAIKCGGDWFSGGSPSDMRHHNSKSTKRKMASALIAKIPFALSSHIARVYHPDARH